MATKRKSTKKSTKGYLQKTFDKFIPFLNKITGKKSSKTSILSKFIPQSIQNLTKKAKKTIRKKTKGKSK